MTDVPSTLVDAAQAYDLENRGRGNWQRVPDQQVHRLIAGALTEAQEQIALAVEKVCVDPEWPGDDISRNGELAACVVRSWPEDVND